MLTEFMEYVEKRFQSGPEDSDVPIDASLREKVIEEFDELSNAHTLEQKIEEYGDILFTLVNAGRRMGIDPEQSLRNSNKKFETRFRSMEKISSSMGADFKTLTIEEKDSLWKKVKKGERRDGS